jgi:hypothetical protein
MAMAGQNNVTILQRLENFLQGSGLPCPVLFKAAQGGFSSIIDLSQVSATSFRARMFVWAITGSPFIDPGADDRISVSHQLLLVALYIAHERTSIHSRLSYQRRMTLIMLRIATRQESWLTREGLAFGLALALPGFLRNILLGSHRLRTHLYLEKNLPHLTMLSATGFYASC